MFATASAAPVRSPAHLAVVTDRAPDEAGIAVMLEALPSGAAVIGPDDRVIAANERFGDMDEVVTVSGHRIVAVGSENAAELRRLLLEARASASVGGRAIAKAAFRDADDKPVFATARPFAGGSARSVLVMVDDLARPARADLATALRLLGLTRSESRVAAHVGSGLSPREAAEAIGCAEQSVRSVLKAVFAKLGIHKQAELNRIVTRLEAMAAA